MRYVMSRILGTDGGSKHRRSPGVHPPLGDRGGQSGGHSRAPCGCGRNQAFFVLMAGAGLVGEAPCAGKILRLTAVQRWLDRFPVMGGKGASATGWGYNHRRAATCSLPGDTAFWVGCRGSVADADGGSCASATGGHITSRRLTAFSPAAPEECTKSNR